MRSGQEESPCTRSTAMMNERIANHEHAVCGHPPSMLEATCGRSFHRWLAGICTNTPP